MANSKGGTASIMPSGMTAGQNRKAQQQMQSMILCKLPPKKDPLAVGSRKSSDAGLMRKKRPTPALLQGMQQLGEEEEGNGDLEAQKASEKEVAIPVVLY